MKVPFNRPHATGDEFAYIREAIDRSHLSGDGAFTKRVHQWLRERTGATSALLTHSCTAALEMMAILLDAGPGDEIVMPSFTFVSTANAFVLRGATPVFVDIDEETINIDPACVETAITSRTKAIVAVHYAGVACDMDALSSIARKHGVALLEDAAQGVGSTYRGRALGSIGELGALSFHETKNLISGEGGALLINDGRFVERAEVVREKGTDRSKFLRGQVDKYTWIDIGSSYLPSDIIAAFLWAQLQHADELLARRKAVWNGYHERLAGLEREGRLRRPRIPPEAGHNGHIYYVLAPDRASRDAAFATLRAQEIGALSHYVPLHSSPAGRRFARTHGELTRTDAVSDRLIRLPMFVDLNELALDRVADALARALP
jgi:dTDP-4-amino-4,6-dideoxygalactose transaminase